MKHSNDLAGAVTILERLISDSPVHERNAPRRVLNEVTPAWPGDVQRLWWKWFTEASHSLGLRCKVVDCLPAEACALAKDHAQFVCFRPGTAHSSAEWMMVIGGSRPGHEVITAGEQGQETKKFSIRKLKSTLSEYANGEKVRCIIVQPQSTAKPTGSNPKPIRRTLELIKPEFSDIWLVAIFAFVVSLLALATPLAVEALVNTVAFGRFLQPIVVLALILLTFLGFQGAVRGLQTFVVEIIQRRLFARIAADLAYRIPRLEAEGTDREHAPELVNRFFDVVTVQKVAAQLLLDGVGLVLSTLIGMMVLGFYHPWLLGFDLLLLSAIGVIIFVLGRGAISSAIKESKHKYYMASWLEDMANAPTAFHGTGGKEFALERADRLIHGYLLARRSHFGILLRQIIFSLGLQAVASTVLLGLGGWLVVIGELTLGQLVAAELIVTVIVGSFAKFGKHIESFYDLLASVDKLGILFDIPTERGDGMLGIDTNLPASVSIYSTSYVYPGASSVLSNLEAEIGRGENVALLGPSGSGKSTLLDVLYGFREPTSGHVTIDEFDPRDLRPDALRSRVALARSETIHATIEENVHMHREWIRTTDAREILNELGVLTAMLKLKDGCQTMLTGDGKPLSENQKRLLSIARAAVGRPGLLMIDGLLDSLSNTEIEQCLEYLASPERGWTLIVATSRADIADRLQRQIELNSTSGAVQS